MEARALDWYIENVLGSREKLAQRTEHDITVSHSSSWFCPWSGLEIVNLAQCFPLNYPTSGDKLVQPFLGNYKKSPPIDNQGSLVSQKYSMKLNEFQEESVEHNQFDLLFTDWTRLGLKSFYKLSNMLYRGNALSDLLDNVFIVEVGRLRRLGLGQPYFIVKYYWWFHCLISKRGGGERLVTGRQLVDVVNLSPVEIIITWLGLIISPIFALPVYQLPASKASKVSIQVHWS